MNLQELKKERLNLLLLKNTIVILVPAVIIFILIFGFVKHYPVIYQMTCHDVDTMEEIREWYEKGCYNVKIRIPQLKYTGYDYYEDEKRTGAYYYTFIDNQCVFFLVRTKSPEASMERVMIQGRVIGDSVSLIAMKSEFSKELGLDYDSFDALVNPLLLSEVDYPYMEILLMWLLLILPYIVTAGIIVLSVIWTIQPYQHPSVRALSEFGERRLVYQEVKSQCKNRLVQHNYNYYITDEYLVISNLATTDFVRIDYIRYISCHVITKMNGKQVYRLTMSNPEKMFYEKDFASETCADEIMTTLLRLNPQIDNRTMKVLESIPHSQIMEEEQKPIESIPHSQIMEQEKTQQSGQKSEQKEETEDTGAE